MEKNNRLSVLLRGLIKENPVLVLVLGTCPTLATSTSLISAVGMGLSATAVLVCSNMVISRQSANSVLYRGDRGLCDTGADAPQRLSAAAV